MNPVQGFLIEILYDLDIQQRKLVKGRHCPSFTDMSTMCVNFESDMKKGIGKISRTKSLQRFAEKLTSD